MAELNGNGHRELTDSERRLVSWMLEHGGAEARPFLVQLAEARATSARCPCGCGSVSFVINGYSAPSGSMRPIADFLFGHEHDLSGVFVYEQDGLLAGLTVYGLAGEPPTTLPSPGTLHECPATEMTDS